MVSVLSKHSENAGFESRLWARSDIGGPTCAQNGASLFDAQSAVRGSLGEAASRTTSSASPQGRGGANGARDAVGAALRPCENARASDWLRSLFSSKEQQSELAVEPRRARGRGPRDHRLRSRRDLRSVLHPVDPLLRHEGDARGVARVHERLVQGPDAGPCIGRSILSGTITRRCVSVRPRGTRRARARARAKKAARARLFSPGSVALLENRPTNKATRTACTMRAHRRHGQRHQSARPGRLSRLRLKSRSRCEALSCFGGVGGRMRGARQPRAECVVTRPLGRARRACAQRSPPVSRRIDGFSSCQKTNPPGSSARRSQRQKAAA